MLARRFSIWCYFACVLASGARGYGAHPPIWQPYREVAVGAPPAAIVPAQHFFEPSAVELITDPLTDVELDQLHIDYCDDSYMLDAPPGDPVFANSDQETFFDLLPSNVIWHSYWAGSKESRTSALALEEFSDDVSLLDVSLGGRTALFRNATRNPQGWWRGWELQIEGAAILRLNLDQNWDFDSAGFRFGVPLILAREQVLWKLAYYHLSSHVGDEFLVRNPGFTRINFSRDVLVTGVSYFPSGAVRLYGETGYAFYDDEGSDPWEFQFGIELARPGPTGSRGSPFLAFNGHLREEVHFGGNLALQTGWLWRGQTGRVLRTGLHYYNGKSPQYEFYNNFEQQIGVGLWQDY